MSKNKGGVILNIASDLSVISPNNSIYKLKGKQSYKPVSYSTVKTGIIGLTKYVATHWAKKILDVMLYHLGEYLQIKIKDL